MSDKLRELVRDMYEELKPGPTGGNDYHDAWQVFGERLTEAALAERAMPSAPEHQYTPGEDVWLDEMMLALGLVRLGEGRNKLRTVLRAFRANVLTNAALAAAQPGEPALSDYAEGVTRGQLMAAEFLEREADANYMPNEPVKVLIKGFASAIRINLKAFGMEAAPPAPSDSERVDWPECEEFYNLMQAYRHTPVVHIAAVKQNYEAVKTWLRRALSSEQAPPSEQEKS